MGLRHSGPIVDVSLYTMAEDGFAFLDRTRDTYGIKRMLRFKDDDLFIAKRSGFHGFVSELKERCNKTYMRAVVEVGSQSEGGVVLSPRMWFEGTVVR